MSAIVKLSLLAGILVLVFACCSSGSVGTSTQTSSTQEPPTAKPTTRPKTTLTVPAGELNKHPDFLTYDEVNVYKRDGTLDSRSSDLEELGKDYLFYRSEILKKHQAGDTSGEDKARASFDQINTWLNSYDENDVSFMITTLEKN